MQNEGAKVVLHNIYERFEGVELVHIPYNNEIQCRERSFADGIILLEDASAVHSKSCHIPKKLVTDANSQIRVARN